MTAEKGKTLLFLCKCGGNVANNVDLDDLAGWAATSGCKDSVISHNLLCSPEGRNIFKEKLSAGKPAAVIIAACSPKMHEKTFMNLAEEVGLNMSVVHMANIREHCGWVTKDKSEATAKAKNLVRAAMRRALCVEDLERRSMEVNTDILIIGGGMAGMEAALSASTAGRKVYLVDREISIGGSVIKSEEVAPNMECSPCLLAPRLAAIRDDKNIKVITNAEVEDILGFYGNFTVKIRKKARYVEESCIGCEACFEVCPVSVKSAFHLGLGVHKAIYTQFAGSVPAAAAIDREHCRHFADGSCDACVSACPFSSINFSQADEDITISVGAVIVATGFESGTPASFKGLGYGSVENVYTAPEFERIASSNGPFGSAIRLKNGELPAAVAVVHCAGSLREDGIPYCSSVCCVNALKVGEMVRKQNPGAQVFNVHSDLVLPSPSANAFFGKQIKKGTSMVRCTDLKAVKVAPQNGRIRVQGPGFEPLMVDMVVLSTGLLPAAGTRKLAGMLNADLDSNGFFAPAHPLLKETVSTIDGVYLAGCAAGPCNVPTAVSRGQAASGDAISRLMPGRKIELEVMTAVISEDLCGGCKLCIPVCPFKAIGYDAEKKVSRVNEAICRGCGTCVATCPSGAAKARHFTDVQIYAEVGGLLDE